jgi:two-component system chemotaxis response regulator CheB
MNTLGKLSPFTCPACRGALWELSDGEMLRYRCHTGHAFSRDTLLGEQSTAIEDALYSALRAVEEKATALRRLSERHSSKVAGDYGARAAELDVTAETLRKLLAGQPT